MDNQATTRKKPVRLGFLQRKLLDERLRIVMLPEDDGWVYAEGHTDISVAEHMGAPYQPNHVYSLRHEVYPPPTKAPRRSKVPEVSREDFGKLLTVVVNLNRQIEYLYERLGETLPEGQEFPNVD